MDMRTGAVGPSLNRRRLWLTAGIAAVCLLAAGLLLMRARRVAEPGRGTAAAQQTAPRGLGSAARVDPAEAAESDAPGQEHGPQFDQTTCWRELDRFNEHVTLQTFRAWAANLLAAADEHVLTYLKERLTELIGADAGRAGEVLGWVRDASPKEAGVFLSALRGSAAVRLPQVAAQLTAMSQDPGLSAERRAGIVAALDTQERFAPATLGRLADLARDASSGEAGWAATRTIGRVMATDLQRTGSAAPYLDKLLTIATESTDDDIRYLAVSMPMHADPILDAAATARYAKILATEGSANGRDAAAHLLSLSSDKAKVLQIFAQAFVSDSDVCVRWALFRFAARAAGQDALPVMADMAAADPRFQEDYQIFAQIYASGVVDFERAWLSLPSQDPHGCLHRPD